MANYAQGEKPGLQGSVLPPAPDLLLDLEQKHSLFSILSVYTC